MLASVVILGSRAVLCWDAGAWSNPGSSDEVERWRGRVCLGWQNCLLFFKGADNSTGSVVAVTSEATTTIMNQKSYLHL